MDQEARYWRDKWLDAERQLTSYMEMLRRKNFNTSGKPYDKQGVAKKRVKSKLKTRKVNRGR